MRRFQEEFVDRLLGITLRWVNVATGDWGPSGTVAGGQTVTLDRPFDAEHWVAVITK